MHTQKRSKFINKRKKEKNRNHSNNQKEEVVVEEEEEETEIKFSKVTMNTIQLLHIHVSLPSMK
jgi:hypothetical protein